jgi:hypothetical protein
VPQLKTGKPSVEQRLFEAYQQNRGTRLTPEDVESLCVLDDAIRTRITNQACVEAGMEEPGVDGMIGIDKIKSWAGFKKKLKKGSRIREAAEVACRGCCGSIGGKGPLCKSCRIASRLADSDRK